MPSLKKRSVGVIDNFDLNIFQLNIVFVILSSFLRFKFNFDAAIVFFYVNNRSHYTVIRLEPQKCNLRYVCTSTK